MNIHDLVNTIAIEQSAQPQIIQAAAVSTGNIDMQGYESLAVAVLVGNISDTLDPGNRIDVKIEHADDDGTGAPGAYTACADADVLNATGLAAGQFLSIDAAGKEQKRHVIGYAGGKRFVKVTATPVSIETGGPIALVALKGTPARAPVANN